MALMERTTSPFLRVTRGAKLLLPLSSLLFLRLSRRIRRNAKEERKENGLRPNNNTKHAFLIFKKKKGFSLPIETKKKTVFLSSWNFMGGPSNGKSGPIGHGMIPFTKSLRYI